MEPMKCPACYNELKPLQAGSLSVDVCQGGCGGIWFDNFELQRVDGQEPLGEQFLDVRRDPRVQVDPARKRECPRCDGIKLHRHYFSAKRRVEVDQCPNCGGYWLDAGELGQIRAEQSQAEAAPEQISIEVVRYLYRLQAQSNADI